MAYTIEAINGKKHKKMKKKHKQMAFLLIFYLGGASFKSNNQLAYQKNREVDVKWVEK